MKTLGELGITLIGGHTTAKEARRGIMFSEGCLTETLGQKARGKDVQDHRMHPSITIQEVLREYGIDHAGGGGA